MTDETRAALLALPDGILSELIMRYRAGGTMDDWEDPQAQALWLNMLAERPCGDWYAEHVAALRAALAEEREA